MSAPFLPADPVCVPWLPVLGGPSPRVLSLHPLLRPTGTGPRRAWALDARRAAAPRLRRELEAQREDPATIHPPELGVERRRQARMVRRLEVVAALDQRVEVPAREEDPRDGLRACVDREIPRPLRSGGPHERLEPRPAAHRRERVP